MGEKRKERGEVGKRKTSSVETLCDNNRIENRKERTSKKDNGKRIDRSPSTQTATGDSPKTEVLI